MSDKRVAARATKTSPPVEVRDRRLDELRKFAWLMDSQFQVPGTSFRFGLDAIVGLVPGVGDLIGAIASVVFMVQAARMGASRAVLSRMAANIGIETVVGTVPLLGDFFDATFKANQRNFRLIEHLAVAPTAAHADSRRLFMGIAIALGAVLVLLGVLALVLAGLILNAILGGRGPLG